MQAIKSLLVDIHHHNLVSTLEQVITQFGAHAPTSDDNKIHKNYSFSSSWIYMIGNIRHDNPMLG